MTGEPLIRRADDNPETLKSRLQAYHKQTFPLVEYYTQRSLHRSIDASLDSNTVFANIKKIFSSAHCEYSLTFSFVANFDFFFRRSMF